MVMQTEPLYSLDETFKRMGFDLKQTSEKKAQPIVVEKKQNHVALEDYLQSVKSLSKV